MGLGLGRLGRLRLLGLLGLMELLGLRGQIHLGQWLFLFRRMKQQDRQQRW